MKWLSNKYDISIKHHPKFQKKKKKKDLHFLFMYYDVANQDCVSIELSTV